MSVPNEDEPPWIPDNQSIYNYNLWQVFDIVIFFKINIFAIIEMSLVFVCNVFVLMISCDFFFYRGIALMTEENNKVKVYLVERRGHRFECHFILKSFTFSNKRVLFVHSFIHILTYSFIINFIIIIIIIIVNVIITIIIALLSAL